MNPDKWVKKSSEILETYGYKKTERDLSFTSFSEGISYENEYLVISHACSE